MMISKKKLREKLLDICNGAGRVWIEGDEYFEDQEDCLESVGKIIQAIEREFELPSDNWLRLPWHLGKFNDPTTMTDLVYEVLSSNTTGVDVE